MLQHAFVDWRIAGLVLLPRFFLVLTVGVGIGLPAGGQTIVHSVPAHTVPEVGLALPENATEAELKWARIFAEPLVPVGRAPSAGENRHLAQALRAHVARTDSDDLSALERFLAEQPDSAWAPSVAFNLASESYNTGWYSKSLKMWERAWLLLKSARDPQAKALADRAAGELAFMYGRLGRMSELSALLDSLKGRVFIGSATEKIAGAREGLWTMQHRPEIAFRCGPYALDRILNFSNPAKAGSPLIRDSKSTTNGCSLSEVAALSRDLGMSYQMAFRTNGAALLLPAVVNWKAGHYAAMLKEGDGRYLLQDPTFGNDTWISRRALEAEASGYFLVPAGALPRGWRCVEVVEGSRVFGKGATNSKDDSCTTCGDKTKSCTICPSWTFGGLFRQAAGWLADKIGNSQPAQNPPAYPYAGIRGMAAPDAHLMVVSLNLHDMPVGYAPPVGPPVWFVATYNQRDAGQPALFSYSNLGPKWTFNWLAFITDNPSSLSADVNLYADGGGTLPFSGFDSIAQTFAPQVKNRAVLKRTSATSYEMLLPSGAKLIFALPGSFGGTSRRVFMTQIIDTAGNAVQITYDNSFRVVGITDAIGQVTTFAYENSSDNLKITKVTDPFGRYASFGYDANNRLAQITDTIGITSQFTYDSGDFIQALTTPYGTTSFEKGENGPQRWLVTTYPNGEKDRVEFYESGSIGIPDAEPAAIVPAGMSVANIYLVYRNTFFWDRKAYAEAAGDYTRAHLYHWLHFSGGVCSGILESEKAPLENRVWYSYDGQPSTITYGTTDQPKAIGRVLDDGTTQLTKYRYNSMGKVTNSVDPAGRSLTAMYSTNLVDLLELRQTTGANNEPIARFQYNLQHLPVAAWSASGQPTTNSYNTRGQLLSVRNARGQTSNFNYDPSGYLISVDGPLPGTTDSVSLTYDAVGRVRTSTGLDGYTITNSYDNFDRLTNVSYPDGTSLAYTYDKLDLAKIKDRLGRETRFTNDVLGRLTAVRDPLNRLVKFEYCGCGALSAVIDALGRRTSWDHDIQGRVISKQYADGSQVLYAYDNTTSRLKTIRDEKGQIKAFDYNPDGTTQRISYPLAQTATPAVTYTYDTNYNRLLAVQDGLGTTLYTYYPAGAAGALKLAGATGPWNNDTVTYQYDELDRVTNRAINGVGQAVAYDTLSRPTNVVNALGSFVYAFDGTTSRLLNEFYPNGLATHYDYFDSVGDHRLQAITHRNPDASLLSRFTYAYDPTGNITNWVQALGGSTNNWSIGYDAADQLLNATITQGTNSLALAETYDAAGNRLTDNVAGVSRTFRYNALNQLAGASDSTRTNTSFEWDAEQRLAAINHGTNRSEFYYDGLGRQGRIVEKQNGAVISDRRFVWCGLELCEERDATGAVVQKRFFPQGFQQVSGPAAGNYFYTRDQLGTVGEMVDASGALRARYSYDAWGARSKLAGDLDADFGFAGYFFHAPSAMQLAPFRAYSPDLGRWLSRDPLGEIAGPNLYAYVANNPLNRSDPLGLCDGVLAKLEAAANAAWNQVGVWWGEAAQELPAAVAASKQALDAAKAYYQRERPALVGSADAALEWIAKYPREFIQGVLGSTYCTDAAVQINRGEDPTVLNQLNKSGVTCGP
jgi:RHS repeat-associated protein